MMLVLLRTDIIFIPLNKRFSKPSDITNCSTVDNGFECATVPMKSSQ